MERSLTRRGIIVGAAFVRMNIGSRSLQEYGPAMKKLSGEPTSGEGSLKR